MSGMQLLLSDNRGVNIPRDFAEFNHNTGPIRLFNIDEDDADLVILRSGPDHEHYWDAWDSVLGRAKYTDSKGNDWYLSQDGDLWMYCEALMTDEEYEAFFQCERETA